MTTTRTPKKKKPHWKKNQGYRGPRAAVHVTGQTVYIGFRVYSTELHRMQNCTGLNIRAAGFTPREVYDVMVQALKDHAEKAQLIAKGHKLAAPPAESGPA